MNTIITRQQCRWVMWFTVFTMLIAQLAVAVHACSAIAAPSTPHSATVLADTCPDMLLNSNQMDADSSGLCLQHCHPDGQDNYHSQIPSLVAASYLPPQHDWTGYSSSLGLLPSIVSTQEHKLARVLSPPKSILHCCFRI